MDNLRSLSVTAARCLAMLLMLLGGVKTMPALAQETTDDFYAVYTPGSPGGTLTFKRCAKQTGDGNTYYAIDYDQYQAVKTQTTKVVIDESFKAYQLTTCKSFFDDFGSLTTIDGLGNLNTAAVQDMSHMFSGCEKLEAIDLSGFDTSSATDMSYMFNRCGSLAAIDLPGFNTARVTTMKGMFSMYNEDTTEGCVSKIKTLDLSSFDTSSVTDMSFMFSLFKSLVSVNLSSFNTARVTTLKGMFSNCAALTTLDLTTFDNAAVQDMSSMFGYCSALATVYVGDHFATQQDHLDSSNMFTGCTTLLGNNPTATDYTVANYKDGVFKTYYKTGDDIHEMQGDNTDSSIGELELKDGKDFVTSLTLKADKVTYTRHMKNAWGTLCLPFAFSTDDVKGCEFYSIWGISNGVLTVSKTSGTIEAGQPVMICRTGEDNYITFAATDAAIVRAPAAADGNSDRLVGTFVAVQVPDDCYNIADNKFWLVSDVATGNRTVWVAGFRSYIQPGDHTAQAKPSTLSIGGGTTAIDGTEATPVDLLNAAASGKAAIYDAAGHRVPRLQKGLNIICLGNKTQKVCIK